MSKLLGHEVRGSLSPLVFHDRYDEIAAFKISADRPCLKFCESWEKDNVNADRAEYDKR